MYVCMYVCMYICNNNQGDEDPDSNDERYHGNDYPEDGIKYRYHSYY